MNLERQVGKDLSISRSAFSIEPHFKKAKVEPASGMFSAKELKRNLKADSFTIPSIRLFLSRHIRYASYASEKAMNENERNSIAAEPIVTREQMIKDKSFEEYFKVVKTLAENMEEEKDFSTVTEFGKALTNSKLDLGHIFKSSWEILAFMTGETDGLSFEATPAKPKNNFSNPYQIEDVSKFQSEISIQSRRTQIERSLNYLHYKYTEELETLLLDNIEQYPIGGRPNILVKIRRFFALKYHNSEKLKINVLDSIQTKFWAYLFCLYRCGNVCQALRYSYSQYENLDDENKLLADYFQLFVNSGARLVPKENREEVEKMHSSIKKLPENLINPFKLFFIELIGRTGLNDNFVPSLLGTLDDFIWFKLLLCQEDLTLIPEKDPQWMLSDIQESIRKLKDKASFKITFIEKFNLFLLTHQFEMAIAHLYSEVKFHSDVIHFTVALIYHGMLRVPQISSFNIENNILSTKTASGFVEVDVYRLFNFILPSFTKYDPEQIICYYTVLACLPHEYYKTTVKKLLIDLIFGTEKYQELIGGITEEKEGLIKRYRRALGLSSAEFSELHQRSTLTIIDRLFSESKFREAQKIFFLVNDYEGCAKAFNTRLELYLSEICLSSGYDRVPIKDEKKTAEVKEIWAIFKEIFESCSPDHPVSVETEHIKNQLTITSELYEASFGERAHEFYDMTLSHPLIPKQSDVAYMKRFSAYVFSQPQSILKHYEFMLYLVVKAFTKFARNNQSLSPTQTVQIENTIKSIGEFINLHQPVFKQIYKTIILDIVYRNL